MLLGNSSREQLESGSSGLDDGGIQLKKGPWTAAEDAILTEYVRKHGEGNWNGVQRNTGLARCGKSCRLRWYNHLRPNLKKGAFSSEEERLIVELHAQLGNKWARMAAQLPGRTDNEIKNYWNTRVKRRRRQGLPLYPPEIQPKHQQPSHSHHSYNSQPTTPTIPTSSFSFPRTTTTTTPTAHHHHPYPSPSYTCSPTAPLSPTPPPLSPNLQSPHHPAFPTLTLFDTNNNNNSNVNNANIGNVFNIPRTPPTLQNPPRFKLFHSDAKISNIGTATTNNNNNNNNGIGSSNFQGSGNFSLPFSPFLRSPSLSSRLNDPQNHCNTSTFSNAASKLLSLPSFSSLPVSFNTPNTSSLFRTPDGKDCILSNDSVFALKPELPSSQLLSQKGNAELNFDNEKLSMSCSGSGLLEDLLEEAQALACNFGECSRRVSEEKREFSGFNQWNDSSSLKLSSGMKPKEETGGQINSIHEDLSKLLNVIPSMQVPGWYTDSGEASNDQSSFVTDENIGLEMQQIASLFRVDSNTDQAWPPGSCSFDNLPEIC